MRSPAAGNTPIIIPIYQLFVKLSRIHFDNRVV